MKLLKSYMAIMVMAALLFTSCSKDEADNITSDPSSENFAELSLGAMLADLANRAALKQALPACSEDAPAYAHVEIIHNEGTDMEGTVEVNVPVIEEDGMFFTDYSESLKIPVANDNGETAAVTLTEFVIFDGDPDDEGSNVIWIAPSTESDYGDFVNQGLPYDFTIRAGSKKYVDVEVLCFDDRDVELYGYQFFNLIPEILHEVCVFANYCNDAGRHFTANYNLTVTYIGGDEEMELYSGLMPETGTYGEDYYADPVCFSVPEPMYDEEAGDDYLRFTLTLEDWDNHYPTPEPQVIHHEVSWNDIEEQFDGDSNVDYFHLFFNCGEDDNGNGNGNGNGECDLDDPDADCDDDGIDNGDENPGCAENPDPDCGEQVGNDCDFAVNASLMEEVRLEDFPIEVENPFYPIMVSDSQVGTAYFDLIPEDVINITIDLNEGWTLENANITIGDGDGECIIDINQNDFTRQVPTSLENYPFEAYIEMDIID